MFSVGDKVKFKKETQLGAWKIPVGTEGEVAYVDISTLPATLQLNVKINGGNYRVGVSENEVEKAEEICLGDKVRDSANLLGEVVKIDKSNTPHRAEVTYPKDAVSTYNCIVYLKDLTKVETFSVGDVVYALKSIPTIKHIPTNTRSLIAPHIPTGSEGEIDRVYSFGYTAEFTDPATGNKFSYEVSDLSVSKTPPNSGPFNSPLTVQMQSLSFNHNLFVGDIVKNIHLITLPNRPAIPKGSEGTIISKTSHSPHDILEVDFRGAGIIECTTKDVILADSKTEESTETTKTTEVKCICPLQDLIAYGCQCGAFATEQIAKSFKGEEK